MNSLPSRSTSLQTEASGTAPPDAFGPFRVLHQIGAGVLGPVFRAYQPEEDRLVAVKWFRLDLPPERVHMLVSALESLTHADLSHPSIAAPIAAGTADVSAYLAQDFVAGDSLDKAMRARGKMSAEEALRAATHLADALDFAASTGIVHGGLHPRDVFVSSDEARLTGLGIARALETVGVRPPLRRPYAAPECVADLAWGRRADVFSLAALVHELLWGRRVTATGSAAADLLTYVAGGSTAALRDVFARALAEDPSARFEDAGSFVRALTEAFPEHAPAPVPSAPRRPPRRPVRREKLPIALGDSPIAPDPPSLPLAEAEVSDTVSDTPIGRGARAERHHPVPDLELRAAAQPGAASAPLLDLNAPREPSVARETTASASTSAPAVAAPPAPPLVAASGGVLPETALDRSRSAVWPLALAMFIGVALGFAGGYGVGSGERQRTQAQQDAVAPPPVPLVERRPEAVVAPAPQRPPSTSATSGASARPAASSPPAKPAAPSQPAKPAPRPVASASPKATAPSAAPKVTASSAARSAPAAASTRPLQVAPSKPAAVAARPASGQDVARSKTTATAPRTSGGLLVTSTPDGAVVLIDGRSAGRTPITLRALSKGVHKVRIIRDGYVIEDQQVTITDAQSPQTLAVELTRPRGSAAPEAPTAPSAAAAGAAARTGSRSTGGLVVESRPDGADVFVDGKLAGKTPLTLESVAPGDHGVRIERAGYRQWSGATRVVAGEKSRVTASLEQ